MKNLVRTVMLGVLTSALCASAATPPRAPRTPQEYAQRLNAALQDLAVLSQALGSKQKDWVIERAPSKQGKEGLVEIACGCPEGPQPNPVIGPRRPDPPPGPEGIAATTLDPTVVQSAKLQLAIELLNVVNGAAREGQAVRFVAKPALSKNVAVR
jgi:hypothetical protein